MDAQLFGGFLSALNTFAGQLEDHGGSGLQNFELSGKRYVIFKSSNLIFIGNFSKDVKTAKAEKELESVVNRFLNAYKVDEIINNQNDPSYFEGFTKQINESLEDLDAKFQDTFW